MARKDKREYAGDSSILFHPMRYLHGFLCQTEFRACVSELMAYHSERAFDAHGARHVLARAPLCSETLNDFGQLLGALLKHSSEKEEPFYIDVDASLLIAYLEAVDRQSLRGPILEKYEMESYELGLKAMEEYIDPTHQGLEFIRVFMRAVLQKEAREAHKLFKNSMASDQHDSKSVEQDPLASVMQALSYSYDAHPALVVALHDRGLDPTLVLDVLNAKDGSDTGELNGPLLHALQALQPVMVQTCWRPQSQLHWDQLWRSHWSWAEDNMHWNKPWMPEFVRIMVHEYGARLPASLDCLRLKKENASQDAVRAFFPLPLMQCDKGELLFGLVSLMPPCCEESSYNQRLFASLLEEYHPVLHAALKLHVEMYPSHGEAVAAWSALMDVFQTIVFGIAHPREEAIDTKVFEGT